MYSAWKIFDITEICQYVANQVCERVKQGVEAMFSVDGNKTITEIFYAEC